MGEQIFMELFSEIRKVTGLKDIGYHEIKDGRLYPRCKTNDGLAEESWKDTHSNNIVYIEEHTILKEIVNMGETIVISNIEEDPRSSSAFFLFGLKSIMIIPIKNDESQVKGILCIVSIGQTHQFTESEIKACKLIVENFIKQTKGDV